MERRSTFRVNAVHTFYWQLNGSYGAGKPLELEGDKLMMTSVLARLRYKDETGSSQGIIYGSRKDCPFNYNLSLWEVPFLSKLRSPEAFSLLVSKIDIFRLKSHGVPVQFLTVDTCGPCGGFGSRLAFCVTYFKLRIPKELQWSFSAFKCTISS